MTMTPAAGRRERRYLEAKLEAAAELYVEGKITRAECFRHEVDVAVQRDSGPINITKRTRSTR